MPTAVKLLVILLACLAGLLYLYSITNAIIATFSEKGQAIGFLSEAATVIGGILSTNLGAVLGVTLSHPVNRPLSDETVTPLILGLRPSIQSQHQRDTGKPNAAQSLQVVACWIYVLSLLAAMIAWFIAQQTKVPDIEVAPLLPELAKTLLGVMVGALTIILGRNTAPHPLASRVSTPK